MKPGTIFVSHRAEYASLVRRLKTAIQGTSKGNIKVFISEDIVRGEKWRAAIENHLRESESLFLVYGAPYEDWSWCFYEAGYFAALCREQSAPRDIFCISRPNIPAPGPLSDLQMVTDENQLVEAVLSLYERNGIEHDATAVRRCLGEMTKGLFGKLREFVTYPRVYFTANDADFGPNNLIPPDSQFAAEDSVLTNLFGIGKATVSWLEITDIPTQSRTPQEAIFMSKWVEETNAIILAARENRFIAPQTVLVSPGGRRFRLLLYAARVQADGRYYCEFLAIDEVSGPAIGMSSQLSSLLTSIRMAFRFRSELIQRFPSSFDELSEEERSARIEEIPRTISNLFIESQARGNINLEDLLSAFDDHESERLRLLLNRWPIIQKALYNSLGLSSDGRVVNDSGLRGANVDKFRTAFEACRLLNIEFLSRCCARVSRMITKSEDDLMENAKILEDKVKALTRTDLRSAA